MKLKLIEKLEKNQKLNLRKYYMKSYQLLKPLVKLNY